MWPWLFWSYRVRSPSRKARPIKAVYICGLGHSWASKKNRLPSTMRLHRPEPYPRMGLVTCLLLAGVRKSSGLPYLSLGRTVHTVHQGSFRLKNGQSRWTVPAAFRSDRPPECPPDRPLFPGIWAGENPRWTVYGCPQVERASERR